MLKYKNIRTQVRTSTSYMKSQSKWRIGMSLAAEEWLNNEDNVCREDRLSRLKWIIQNYPDIEIAMLQGGLKSHYLFEEARYSFVYGQFFASTMLSLAFIENSLSSYFFGAGRNDLKRAGAFDLLNEAKKEGIITNYEFNLLDKVRKLRNPITHFKEPMNEESIEIRGLKDNKHPYIIIEDDAKKTIYAMFKLMGKQSLTDYD